MLQWHPRYTALLAALLLVLVALAAGWEDLGDQLANFNW